MKRAGALPLGGGMMNRSGGSSSGGRTARMNETLRRGRTVLVGAALLALASCMALPRKRVEVFLFDPLPAGGTWAVDAVEVDHRTMAEQIRRMLPQILSPLARAYDLPVAEGEYATLLVDLQLAERELPRDLDTVNAMSVTATLRERESGRLVGSVLYSEESKESLASFYHLWDVMDGLLKALAGKRRQLSKKG